MNANATDFTNRTSLVAGDSTSNPVEKITSPPTPNDVTDPNPDDITTTVVYRLDPEVPLVWRNPTTVQFGVDRILCTFTAEEPATERMLHALASGATIGYLRNVAADSGCDPGSADRLLRTVAPALLSAQAYHSKRPEHSGRPSHPGRSPHSTHSGHSECRSHHSNGTSGSAGEFTAAREASCFLSADTTIALDGRGPTIERLAAVFNAVDIHLACQPSAAHATIIVASYAITPSRYASWLHRDIPHLAIVYGDRTVRLGPFVEPGAGPCLRCVDLARREQDPAWPVIASQLVGRVAPTEEAFASSVTLRAAELVRARLHDDNRGLKDSALIIEARDGSLQRHHYLPRAECGCQALPESGRGHENPG